MKKIYLALNSFFIICFLLIISISEKNISSYYSDLAKTKADISTGDVKYDIENLKLDNNEISLEKDPDINDGIITINTSQTFSFSIKNQGTTDIDYVLDIQISWDNNLPESGNLLVYPDYIDDETIYENLQNGNYSDAAISADVSDAKEIQTSTGTKLGILETINRSTLSNLLQSNTKDYSFKLFFYMNDVVNDNLALFANKFIEVNVVVHADITGKQTNWASTKMVYFRTVSLINTTIPVIEEIPLPKTYFISQANAINLNNYAAAYDEIDGNITDNIIITSFPEFNPDKAGVYKINYNIKNNSGIFGAPLQITITVWDFIKTVSGTYHSLALTSHGRVYAWGRNFEGQLGTGNYTNRNTPTLLDINNIIDIAACNSSSYALTSDGQVYSWGHNGYGHLGDGTTVRKNTPVKVIQPDGVIFVQISAHFDTIGAITQEGDVYTWGYGRYGQCGTGTSSEINPIPEKIDIANVAMLKFGRASGAALTNDGKVYTWGSNSYGQLGIGGTSSEIYAPTLVSYFNENIKIVQIDAGGYHMAAISDDGKLFTWGTGYNGVIGNGTTNQQNTPVNIPLSFTVSKVITGSDHNAIISSEGNVYVFGSNTFGKLGTGDTETLLSPTLLNINNVTYVSLGEDNTFILVNGQTLYGTGNGNYGALGSGNDNTTYTPVMWTFVPPAPY